jgi:hypothetical protein
VKRVQKQWLAAVPWQSVLSINQALCQAQKTEHKPNSENYLSAQHAWEGALPRQMTLPEVLDLCKKCCNLSPFVFNNGNTFAAISKTLIEDWLKAIPPVEAQIIRTTVAHYVAGLVGRRELLNILDHFEPVLKSSPAPTTPPSAPRMADAPVQVSQPSA